MNQDPMTSQLAAVNRSGDMEKPKPAFIALFGIICALLIAGIIAAVVSASVRKNPANLALDAVNHLLDASTEPVVLKGSMSITPTASTVTDDTPVKIMEDGEGNPQNFAGINLTITAKSSLLPTELDLEANVVIGEAELPVKASITATETGKVYLKVTGLKTAIDGYLESFGLNAKYFEHFEEYQNISSLYSLIGTLEGSYWELDLGTDYSNLVTILNAHAKNPETLKNLYAEAPFITLSPTSDDHYLVTIDPAIYEDSHAFDCDQTPKDAQTLLPVQDCQTTIPTIPDIVITLDNEHRIKTISLAAIAEDYAFVGEFTLDYPDSITIEAPKDYQPIDNLFMSLLETIDY